MAEKQPSVLSDELDEWLADQARSSEHNREELLARAVATYRLLSEADDARPADAGPTLDERIESLQTRVDAIDTETDERIEDVRNRVIQVLKTAKGKADPDHDHPELTDTVADVDDELSELSKTVSDLEAERAALEDTVDGGFENFEQILTSLSDRVDEVDTKLTTLAGAIVDLRKRAVTLESENARRAAVEELQADALSQGVRAGNCEACNRTVELGLLTAPRCPHCQEPFTGVEPGGRFLGSATITVGDQPAITGESLTTEDPEELFETDE